MGSVRFVAVFVLVCCGCGDPDSVEPARDGDGQAALDAHRGPSNDLGGGDSAGRADAIVDGRVDDVAAADVAGGDASVGPPPDASGGPDDPFIIDHFPYRDHRDTVQATEPLFDVYGCMPNTDEGGDGFLYRVRTPGSGVLRATLDDVGGDGVDVDVHLLTEYDADACLIRDNIGISYPVEQGAYLLAIDTWVDDEGRPRPGPYVLDVDFVPDVPEQGPLGAAGWPIPIERFPYVDTRDTRQAPGMHFDSYSCEPDIDESGAEFVYSFTVARSGTFTARVDDESNDEVDIDLHLLSSPDAAHCLVRDDREVERSIGPGRYFIVADTWVDRAGVAYPGQYTLRADFIPDVAPGDRHGTMDSPIVVDSFPFTDRRDTTEAPSDVFDAYSCAPNVNESGGEFIYELRINQASFLHARVSDAFGDAVDIDLHLLSELDTERCLTRDNISVAARVAPGTYYLVADTWTTGSGTSLAGPYLLEVKLYEEPDLASFCVVLYGDTRGRSSGDPQTAHQRVVDAIDDQCPTMALVHSGDLVRSGYSDGDWARFLEIEARIFDRPGRTLFPTRGNHDGSWANLGTRLGDFAPNFPERSYWAHELHPGLTLIILDSEASPRSQAPWLAEQLDAPERRDHLFIVAFHRPLYPSIGGHAGFRGGQDAWMPIFRRHSGRVLALSGHNHALSREAVDGVSMVTSGGGGAPLYGCSAAHGDTRYCGDAHGYYVCDASLRCIGYVVDPLTGAKTVRDVFSVSRP